MHRICSVLLQSVCFASSDPCPTFFSFLVNHWARFSFLTVRYPRLFGDHVSAAVLSPDCGQNSLVSGYLEAMQSAAEVDQKRVHLTNARARSCEHRASELVVWLAPSTHAPFAHAL